MATFEPAFNYVMENEGGLSDHPADRGGLTKYGITLPMLREVPGWQDADEDALRGLSRMFAKQVYQTLRWGPPKLGNIADQESATKVLDMVTNFGPTGGAKLVQIALNDLGYGLAVDGVIGPVTRGAINSEGGVTLVPALCCASGRRYLEIVESNASQKAFLMGWMRRAMRTP